MSNRGIIINWLHLAGRCWGRLWTHRTARNELVSDSRECRNYQAGLPPVEWFRLLGSSVYLLSDGRSLGKIEAISKDLVVIKQGCAKVTRYYISHNRLRYWIEGGSRVWIDLTLDELSSFVRQDVPNPSSFVTLGSHFPNPPFAFED
ncbi:MAG: hypothetical protein AB1351_07775 [Thermoproteota archaeon]